MTTFEEAKRCPKCSQPGEDAKQQGLPQGRGTVHYIYCRNTLCTWLDTSWVVQVRPDGTIPDLTREPQATLYRPLSNDQIAIGQRIVEDAVGRDLRDS